MNPNYFPHELTSQEYRSFILPALAAALADLLAFLVTISSDASLPPQFKIFHGVVAVCAAAYILLFIFYLIPSRRHRESVVWLNAVFCGLGFSALVYSIPRPFLPYYNILFILMILPVSVFSGRMPTLLLISLGTIPYILQNIPVAQSFMDWSQILSVPILAVIISETMLRLQSLNRRQINRLEIVNEFSRQVASTLDRRKIISLLDGALPSALTADSYYLGIQEEDEIAIPLFRDDGEYFNGTNTPMSGSLSGWVIRNQRELFLPDLRQPIDLEGVSVVVAGKEKASLSWIGVPLTTSNFKGLLALASYLPNAFNRSDMELLANLGQHVALALDNARQHAEVEERSHLDSMTGVLNHGYFLKILQQQADRSIQEASPLSLIMLDVDHFKQYNDRYGHLTGDRVLNHLCAAIRSHIKSSDAVGRWGGEEFIVSLPNTNVDQAGAVAERISQTLRDLQLTDRDGNPIPAPTVSQGLALFPAEADDIIELIDLADKRLYLAKARGRNQVESLASSL